MIHRNPLPVSSAGLILLLALPAEAEFTTGTVCSFPDLSGMSPVIMQPGATVPSGTGGPVAGGRWELIRLLYTASVPATIVGQAIGAIELDAADPLSGQGSVALEVDISSPTLAQVEQTGAGPYLATGTVLSFTNDCGGELTLGDSEYTIDTSGTNPVMSLWGSFDVPVTDPFPIIVTVQIEADFELVEPQLTGDPVFDDRFEAP